MGTPPSLMQRVPDLPPGIGSYRFLYFSDLMKRPVCAGKIRDRVGRLTDLVFALKEPYPDENVMFPMGACFIVPVGKILSRSCSTYKALYDFVMQTPELQSHVLERMWPIIFHNEEIHADH